MSVYLEDESIHLTGSCRVEDAEPLVALLLEDRTRGIVMGKCILLHTAVFQVFLAFRPRIVVPASDPVIYGLLLHVSCPASTVSADGGRFVGAPAATTEVGYGR